MSFFGRRMVKRLKAKGDVTGLIEALSAKDKSAQTLAAKALGDLHAVDAVEPLIGLLTAGGHWAPRFVAAEALGQLADVRAVEPLITQLEDEHFLVRRTSAKALGRLKDARAMQPLRDLLERERPGPDREQVASALAELTAGGAGDIRAEVSAAVPSRDARCSVCQKTKGQLLTELKARTGPRVALIGDPIGACPECGLWFCFSHSARVPDALFGDLVPGCPKHQKELTQPRHLP